MLFLYGYLKNGFVLFNISKNIVFEVFFIVEFLVCYCLFALDGLIDNF